MKLQKTTVRNLCCLLPVIHDSIQLSTCFFFDLIYPWDRHFFVVFTISSVVGNPVDKRGELLIDFLCFSKYMYYRKPIYTPPIIQHQTKNLFAKKWISPMIYLHYNFKKFLLKKRFCNLELMNEEGT